MVEKNKTDKDDAGGRSKPYTWWICSAIVAVVIVAIVRFVQNIVTDSGGGFNGGDREGQS